MRILVTGGAGYVGSACLRYLLARGCEAFAIDDLSQGHAEAIPKDRLIVGDINDTDGLGAVGAYKGLDRYTRLGGVLSVFSLP